MEQKLDKLTKHISLSQKTNTYIKRKDVQKILKRKEVKPSDKVDHGTYRSSKSKVDRKQNESTGYYRNRFNNERNPSNCIKMSKYQLKNASNSKTCNLQTSMLLNDRDEHNEAFLCHNSTRRPRESIDKNFWTKKKRKTNEASAKESEKHILAKHWIDSDNLDWGRNLLLIGDAFWSSFLKYSRIKNKISRMEDLFNKDKFVNFRLSVRKENEIIDGLFDNIRNRLLFPLPPKIKKVCISIGGFDILNIIEHLKSSKPNCAEEIKDTLTLNESAEEKFKVLANSIICMVKKLNGMNKDVLLLVPFSSEHAKYFEMWQIIIQRAAELLHFPNFQLLYFSDVMKSSEKEFENSHQVLKMWNPNNQHSFSLSEYGCIRLFHAVEEAMLKSHPII